METLLFLFLSSIFLAILIFGTFIERFRIPWIFSALIIGILLSEYNQYNLNNPFIAITGSEIFNFLAEIGMYFLLFVIGFEIDLRDMLEKSGFILKSTFFIIFLEAFFGTLLIYVVFNSIVPDFSYSIPVSFLVALSFATVGEAVLIPILDEFKVINTNFGQSIIEIGCLDDLIEVFALILMAFLVG